MVKDVGASNPIELAEQSLLGVNAIVTGATSGIGMAVVEALASKDAHVIFAIRNSKKAERVAKEIRSRVPNANLTTPPSVPVIDMMDADSIANFAHAINEMGEPLHVLINNAGMSRMDNFHTSRGVASLAQSNYLGTYQLNRLLERKMVADKTRLVFVSSFSSRTCIIQDPQLFLTSWYHSWYKHTKLAEVLFAFEMQRRFGDLGLEVVSVDPGGVNTAIWTSTVFSSFPIKQIIEQVYAPPEDAAKIVMHATFVPWDVDAQPGVPPREDLRFYARGLFASPLLTNINGSWASYLGTVKWAAYASLALVHSFMDYPVRHLSKGRLAAKVQLVSANPQAYDADLAKKLWELSAEYAGIQNLDLLEEVGIQPKRQLKPSPQIPVEPERPDVLPERDTAEPKAEPTEKAPPPTAEASKAVEEPSGKAPTAPPRTPQPVQQGQVLQQYDSKVQPPQQEQQQVCCRSNSADSILTLSGEQSVEDLKKLQEEVKQATGYDDPTLASSHSALGLPPGVQHLPKSHAPVDIVDIIGASSDIAPTTLGSAEPVPRIIAAQLPVNKGQALALMGAEEGPIQRAAILLADHNALPALKTSSQHLVEAGVDEPQAAISAAIISLGAAGPVGDGLRMMAAQAASKPRAARLLVESAASCLYLSNAIRPIEAVIQELCAAGAPCPHADVAAAILAFTPQVPSSEDGNAPLMTAAGWAIEFEAMSAHQKHLQESADDQEQEKAQKAAEQAGSSAMPSESPKQMPRKQQKFSRGVNPAVAAALQPPSQPKVLQPLKKAPPKVSEPPEKAPGGAKSAKKAAGKGKK